MYLMIYKNIRIDEKMYSEYWIVIFFFYVFDRPLRPIAATTHCLHLSLSFAHSSAFLPYKSFKSSCTLSFHRCLGRPIGLFLFFSFSYLSNQSFRSPHVSRPTYPCALQGPNNGRFLIETIQIFDVSYFIYSVFIPLWTEDFP